jgi:hypothetical protein
MEATVLDLSHCGEAEVRRRLDREIPRLIGSGVRYVIVDVSACRRLRRRSREALDLAHRELRVSGGRLVVVAPRMSDLSVRHSNGLLVVPSLEQAHAELGTDIGHAVAA